MNILCGKIKHHQNLKFLPQTLPFVVGIFVDILHNSHPQINSGKKESYHQFTLVTMTKQLERNAKLAHLYRLYTNPDLKHTISSNSDDTLKTKTTRKQHPILFRNR